MSASTPRDRDHALEEPSSWEADGPNSWRERELPPLVEQGLKAFLRDQPSLLRKHPYDWVAYSGDRRIGIARSREKLYERCLRQGLGRGEFVIRGVSPVMDGQGWEEFCEMAERLNSPEEELPRRAEGAASLRNPELPPLIEQGLVAFRRDLPELLPKHEGKYVAYSGDRRIGITRSQWELDQRCLRQGLLPHEYVVRGITPEGAGEIDPAEFLDI
jgi:hypothetical protein